MKSFTQFWTTMPYIGVGKKVTSLRKCFQIGKFAQLCMVTDAGCFTVQNGVESSQYVAGYIVSLLYINGRQLRYCYTEQISDGQSCPWVKITFLFSTLQWNRREMWSILLCLINPYSSFQYIISMWHYVAFVCILNNLQHYLWGVKAPVRIMGFINVHRMWRVCRKGRGAFNELLNLLWPSDAIWWHGSGSIMTLVMICHLTISNNYRNQCWTMSHRGSSKLIHPILRILLNGDN